jgi:replication fork protection complex subunit Tof1/Swi1
MLSKRPRRRRRMRSPSPGLSDSEDGDDWDAALAGVGGKTREEREQRKAARKARKEAKEAARKTRKKQEAKVYKSAQFIEDSDADMDEDFWDREKKLRERMEAAATNNLPPAMRATGTKKRKNPKDGSGKGRKKKRGDDSNAGRADEDVASASDIEAGDDTPDSIRGLSEAPTRSPSDAEDDSDQTSPAPTRARPKPRPKPRPVRKAAVPSEAAMSRESSPLSSRHTSVAPPETSDEYADASSTTAPVKRNRIVISDEED